MQHNQLICMKSSRALSPFHVKFDLARLIDAMIRPRAVIAETDRALIEELDHRLDRADDRGADREADRKADALKTRPRRTRLVAVLMIRAVAAHLMIRPRGIRLIADRVKFDFDRMQPEFFNVQFDVRMQSHRWFKVEDLISQRTQQAQQKQQKQRPVWLAVQQAGVAARKQREQREQREQRKQQEQQVFRTDMEFDDHTKFVACRKFKLGRRNSDLDRTKKFDCIAFQYDCIKIDFGTKPELNRMKRHFDRTKSDADEKSDCMNSETYKNSELHYVNSEKRRKFDFDWTNFELDCMRPNRMKTELDYVIFETYRNSELDRTKSELDEENFSCNCRNR